MNRSLFIIFSTIALDAVGIGLIFPILPALLQEITHHHQTALYIVTMKMNEFNNPLIC